MARLTDEEVWLRGYCIAQQSGGLAIDEAERALKAFREKFPAERDIEMKRVAGIGKGSVSALVDLLMKRGRSDAAKVIEAVFQHIDETGGLSPEWLPPARG